MVADNKKKQDQEEEDTTSTGVLVARTGFSSGSTMVCSADQCSIRPPVAQSSVSAARTLNHFESGYTASPSVDGILNQDHATGYLSGLIPDSLVQMIIDAATQGFLVSFFLTLSDEALTGYLKSKGYSDERISLGIQALRAAAFILVGSSPQLVLATPFASYLLTRLGVSRDTANNVTTGLALGYEVFTSPLDIGTTALTVATSIGAALLGGKAVHATTDWLRQRFFSSAKPKEAEVNAPRVSIAIA